MKRIAMVVTALLAWPAALSAQVVEYYHLDAIGNVRVVTDQATQVVERHDYLPFGEEWCPGPPPGTCSSVPPGQPKRFTGKERDAETGLDYFGARYYRSNVGRFTTTDPVYTWSENLVDPQRWNRYAYARNNPLRYTDPDGKIIVPVAVALGVLFVLNNVANANVTQGPVNDTIVPNSVLLVGAYGFTAGGARLAVKEVLEEASGVPIGGLRGLGDLTSKEAKQIQQVVDQAGRPLEVVGSAARGTRRGVDTDLPIGKGPGTRSDIDYLIPPSSRQHYEGLEGKLPGIDPRTGVIPGTHNPHVGPAVRFEPKAPPRSVPEIRQ